MKLNACITRFLKTQVLRTNGQSTADKEGKSESTERQTNTMVILWIA